MPATKRRASSKHRRTQLQTWSGPRGAEKMTNCIEQPSDEEVRKELVSLPGGDQISCIELAISKTHHMALAGSVREGFYARHEEYSAAGRWESSDDDLPLDTACRLLSGYRDGIDTWRNLVKWQRCSIKPALTQQHEARQLHDATNVVTKVIGFVWGFMDGFRKKR
jgi:hypothetical protein